MSRIVCVVGSRDYPLPDLVEEVVERVVWYSHEDITILSGGAKGVDSWAVDAARRLHCATRVINANWEQYGKSAGYRRNEQLVALADLVIAFWDESSRGTKHTIDIAKREGVHRLVYGLTGSIIFDSTAQHSVRVEASDPRD